MDMPTVGIEKRQSTDELDGLSAFWNYGGTVYDDYSESDSVADASGIFGLPFKSDGSQLISKYVCSTLSLSNGDNVTHDRLVI